MNIEVHAIIAALRRLREKNYHNLETSLGYIEQPCLKRNRKYKPSAASWAAV